MKKLITLGITAALVVSFLGTAHASGRSSTWARDAIDKANQGAILTSETYIGDFTEYVTRAEVARLAVKAFENYRAMDHVATTDPFSDTDDPYVLSANELGIMSGRGNGQFSPNDKITRQELAKVMLTLRDSCTGDWTAPYNDPSPNFKDQHRISTWAKPFVARAVNNGIISGYEDGRFAPLDNATRQETVALVTRTVSLNAAAKPAITSLWNGQVLKSSASFSVSVESGSNYVLYAKAYDNATPIKIASGKKGKPATVSSGKLKANSAYKIYAESGGVFSNEISLFTDKVNLKLEVNDGGTFGHRTVSWPTIDGVTDYTLTIVENRRSRHEGDIPPNTPVVYSMGTSTSVQVYLNPNRKYHMELKAGDYTASTDIFTQRVYNPNSEAINASYPTTQAEAKALQITITVPVWRLSGGKKVSSTATITLHRDIAEKMELVFEEIYNGKEKFPIKDVGAYAWRGGRSEHNGGTAIDINYNENYCIYNDGTTIGAYWKPGVDVYSINPYGDVVNAFEKHGFTWGGDSWNNPRDYMHFSYLGT